MLKISKLFNVLIDEGIIYNILLTNLYYNLFTLTDINDKDLLNFQKFMFNNINDNNNDSLIISNNEMLMKFINDFNNEENGNDFELVNEFSDVLKNNINLFNNVVSDLYCIL